MNRSFRFCAMLVVGLVLFLMAASERTRAAITYTGDIAPDNPVAWDTNTEAYIGSTDVDTGITSGSVTVNNDSDLLSHFCYIGRYCDSMGEVTVDGAGSTWTNNNDLYLGYGGEGNLYINNGGTVSSSTGYIGYEYNWLGGHGLIRVDGVDSTYTNSGSLYIGNGSFGSGSLTIRDRGLVTVANDTWVAPDPYSSGGIFFYSGTLTTGGLLCNFDDLHGWGTINTHGLVSDVDLVFDATHGLSQTFDLTDGPSLDITINLNVDGSGLMGAGYSGVGSMTISQGSNVSSTDGYIGYKSGSTGVITVDGDNSTWTNSGNLYVASYGDGTLNITNGGDVSNNSCYIGRYSHATPHSMGLVTVDGVGSTLANSGELFVGSNEFDSDGSGTLNITNAGVVSNKNGYIGYGNDATGVVTVDGPNSTLTNSEDLHIGYHGIGTLNITGGGVVSNDFTYIGTGWEEFDPVNFYHYIASPWSGEVNVDGDGSTCTSNNDLYVGYKGDGTLDITNDGAVSNSTGYIGHFNGSMGEVAVDGANSIWTNNNDLYVGYSGAGTLNITNAATVSNSTGYIGYGSHSSGVVTVDGAGSTWTNSGELFIGVDGYHDYSSGTLNITNGGTVSNSTGHIGFENESTGTCVVTVDGTNSTWTNDGNLYISYQGNNTLNITNGGTVSNDIGYIGRYSDSPSVSAILLDSAIVVNVDGEGSTWTNSGDLYVGYYSGNPHVSHCGDGTLNITNGGTVSNSSSYIGYYSDSTGKVTVDGAGSTWTNSESLRIGYYGAGTLNITNAATVSNSIGYIGYYSDSTGEIIIDGGDSALNQTGDIHIGYYGAGMVTIQNGAKLTNMYAHLGENAGAVATVVVKGSESQWNNHYNFYAGMSGSAKVCVEGGGSLISNYSHIGKDVGGQGQVKITGTDSSWTTYNRLYVGLAGSGVLDVENGGYVTCYYGYIAGELGSDGEATIIGTNSIWNIDRHLYVGGDDGGAGGTGLLNVSDSGKVVARDITNWETGTIALGVSGDDMFVVGTDFTNDGVVRLSAGAHLAAGTYTPISVGGDWLGIGSYEACGGLWDEMLHTFSVAEVQDGSSGVETILDLSDAPRLDITDDLTGRQVGASFSQGTGTIGFTATAMTEPGGLADLSIQLMSNETILSGWNFETDLADGEEVLLSFYIGDGHAVESLNIWHYDDAGNWTEFDAADLTYSDGWASFTVDGFSGYAMIATVPEPTMLSMAALAGLALLALLHRKRPC